MNELWHDLQRLAAIQELAHRHENDHLKGAWVLTEQGEFEFLTPEEQRRADRAIDVTEKPR